MASMTTMIKVVFAFLLVGIILFLIGFPTQYWVSSSYSHGGIWNIRSGKFISKYDPDWLNATRAMCLIGFFCAVAAVIITLLYMFITRCRGNKTLSLVAIITALVGGVCILIGIAVFGSKYDSSYLGWSFILTTISGIIFVLCAILIVVERR